MKELIRKIKTKKFFNDKAILCKKDYSGRTIAHLQASYGWITSDLYILKLADKNGWTVAHEMASQEWETNDKEIMRLSDKNRWTVAHEMALNGKKSILDNKTLLQFEILTLEDKDNKSVFELLFDKFDENLLSKLDNETKALIIMWY